VHVIIETDGFPVEVQVRTYLQDRWANETEALGDTWGRGLRYGLPPNGATPEQIAARVRAVDANIVVSDRMYELEQAVDATRKLLAAELQGPGLTTAEELRKALKKHVDEFLDPPNDALIAALDEFRRLQQLVP